MGTPAEGRQDDIETTHHYPHSRGRALHHIGAQLERVAGGIEQLFLVASHPAEIAKKTTENLPEGS